MISFLRDERQFSFCFVVTKERKLNADPESAKAAIDGYITKLTAAKDAAIHGELITRMRNLRRRAEAKTFNVRLLADIFLVTDVVTVIAYLLTKWASPRIVSWFSDRDNMTTAWGKIANDLFEINYSAICQQRGVAFRRVGLGLGNPVPDPSLPTRRFGPYSRLPRRNSGSVYLPGRHLRGKTAEGAGHDHQGARRRLQHLDHRARARRRPNGGRVREHHREDRCTCQRGARKRPMRPHCLTRERQPYRKPSTNVVSRR
jgi:hypothetical protein